MVPPALVPASTVSRFIASSIVFVGEVCQTAVSSVPAALAALAAAPPHVIVSDIGLPGEDGYSFMAKLQTSAIRPPAIALTAYARAEDRDRILASGFARHLAKPVDPEVMAKVVREMVA